MKVFTNRPKLVDLKGHASSARATLALFIAESQAADGRLEVLKAARARLNEKLATARARVAELDSQLAIALDRAAESLVASVMGESQAEADPIGEVRVSHMEAEHLEAAAQVALHTVEEQVTAGEAACSDMRARISNAVIEVLKEASPVAILLTELERLQREFVRLGHTFDWLVSKGVLPGREYNLRHVPQADNPARPYFRMQTFLSHLPMHLLDGAGDNHEENRRLFSEAHLWDEAAAALQRDANAALPE